jgi:hypothetical protein
MKKVNINFSAIKDVGLIPGSGITKVKILIRINEQNWTLRDSVDSRIKILLKMARKYYRTFRSLILSIFNPLLQQLYE